jgi:hypothetical protein
VPRIAAYVNSLSPQNFVNFVLVRIWLPLLRLRLVGLVRPPSTILAMEAVVVDRSVTVVLLVATVGSVTISNLDSSVVITQGSDAL